MLFSVMLFDNLQSTGIISFLFLVFPSCISYYVFICGILLLIRYPRFGSRQGRDGNLNWKIVSLLPFPFLKLIWLFPSGFSTIGVILRFIRCSNTFDACDIRAMVL